MSIFCQHVSIALSTILTVSDASNNEADRSDLEVHLGAEPKTLLKKLKKKQTKLIFQIKLKKLLFQRMI